MTGQSVFSEGYAPSQTFMPLMPCTISFAAITFGQSEGFHSNTRGRPEDKVKTDAFIKAMQFLERNDEEQTTVSDAVQKMRDALEVDVEPYSNVYMNKKILEQFGTRILISTVDGK